MWHWGVTQQTKSAKLCKSENSILTWVFAVTSGSFKSGPSLWRGIQIHLFIFLPPTYQDKRKSGNVICTSWPFTLLPSCLWLPLLPDTLSELCPGTLERMVLCSFGKLIQHLWSGCKFGNEVNQGPLALMGLKSAPLHTYSMSPK